MRFDGRYLTPAAKRATLRAFAETRATLITPPNDHGERGYPDTDILPWCDRLNTLEGVCTLQSCAGHVRADGTLVAGGLWLWLAPDVAGAFHARAFELVRHSPPMERITTIYTEWGQEIADIAFHGSERDRLAESMGLILRFFSNL